MSFKYQYQNSGEYQCFACGYMDDDYSFFTVVNASTTPDLMCVGCHENYLSDCDTVEDGDDYQ